MNKLVFVSLVIQFASLSLFSQTVILRPDGTTGQDAIVFEGRNNVNLGWQESLTSYVWTYQGGVARKRFLLDFDFTAIPSSAIIDSVFLDLFYNPTDPYEGFDTHTGANSFTIQKVINPWDELTVTWQNQPATDATVSLTLPASLSGKQDYLDIDVTKFFQDAHTSPTTHHGILVKMSDESSYYKSVLFASSNHANESLRPRLRVHYHVDSLTCQTIKPDFEASSDAKVFTNRPNDNFNSYESLTAYTWTFSGRLNNKRIFLGFDLSVIPTNATLHSANLELFYNPTDNYESFDYHTGSNNFIVERVVSSWNAGTITWNNQPSTTSLNAVFVPNSTSPTQDYQINVTELVRDMLNPSNGNHGFRLKLNDEANPYSAVLFASSEHPNEGLHPALNVCWYVPQPPASVSPTTYPPIYLSPNPTFTGRFQLSDLRGTNLMHIEVFDMLGRSVQALWETDGTIWIEGKGQFIVQIVLADGTREVLKVLSL